jgi:4-hydroxythreonine-4-phosphate dehydrogenase
MSPNRLPILITMGDAAGIGAETIVAAHLQQPEQLRNTVVLGDVACMRRAAALYAGPGQTALPVALLESLAQVPQVPPGCIAVLQVEPALQPPAWGQVSAQAGAFAGACVFKAAEIVLSGQASAMVTAPLHKEALSAAGLPYSQYPGHTEMLQAAAARRLQCEPAALPVRMMLANAELRTVLVSIHVSLRKAIEAVTYEQVLQTLLVTDRALRSALGRAPRIAVAGLNPHAGEGGLFGREEIDIIVPAMQEATLQGCQVSGPWSPDTVFMRARRPQGQDGEFDVVVAMYHDQGLIPVKYLGVDEGVNVTLGLPLVRTSPDHGTAFDIAGTAQASPQSLLQALEMARVLVRT